jgi:alkylation response protein AidB-like acyl-CoA dehydrogenase
MDVTLTDEQQELARTIAGFLDKQSAESEVRRLMAAGAAADPAVWRQMAEQLGLAGLVIPERYGGGGFGFRDFALVAEQAGAALLVSPLLTTVTASAALLLGGDDVREAWLPSLASGQKIATLALTDESGNWAADAVTAHSAADGTVTGAKMYVLDGQFADVFLVSARDDSGVSLYLVDAKAPGVLVTPLDTLDMTRAQARVEFSSAPAAFVAGGDALNRVLAIAGTLLAAEQVGGAQRCLDMAVEYAKVRVQFGRPIGSFQAIKHKCANMLLDVESARSAAYHAAAVLDDPSESPYIPATLAQAHCSAAYTRVAGENIQIHGGIGFTWEHPAHLYFKRAKSSELLYGDVPWQRARLADLVGI